jgi:tetratricopeptide (TPR) repeat protein
MGLFTDNELSQEQVNKLNELLPEELRKDDWKESDFKNGYTSIYYRLGEYLLNLGQEIEQAKKTLEELIESRPEAIANGFKLFNTELYQAKPLGMVDIGIVEKFSAPSTGDRFAGGAIGYALESSFDNIYAKSNNQERAVNKAKLELIKKARVIYPNSNMLFKYEVDFRELGSSGNVFIYMRATACIGENDQIGVAIKKLENDISLAEKKILDLSNEEEKLTMIKEKIPQSKSQISTLL